MLLVLHWTLPTPIKKKRVLQGLLNLMIRGELLVWQLFGLFEVLKLVLQSERVCIQGIQSAL